VNVWSNAHKLYHRAVEADGVQRTRDGSPLGRAKPSFEVFTVQQIHPWLALGVLVSTAATDAVYVLFSAAVAARRRLPAATWSSVWYLLSAFAVISYTRNWVYVCFAALGSWIGAYLSMTFLQRGTAAVEHSATKSTP
jgi:hypothetical protein